MKSTCSTDESSDCGLNEGLVITNNQTDSNQWVLVVEKYIKFWKNR